MNGSLSLSTASKENDGLLEHHFVQEAARMAELYSQAALTISALDSDASTKGFLGDRQRRHVRIHDEMSVCAETLTIGDIFENCSLETRGWCMQERLLSPALLHFSKDQMMWECQQGVTLEQSGMQRRASTLQMAVHAPWASEPGLSTS